jgi:hypothetical protein
MKKLYLLLLLLFPAVSFAQTVNNVPLKDVDVEYVQIVGTARLLSTKVSVEIDFGQETKFFSRDMQIRDEKGKLLIFNSMIDALNFMTANGYEFVQAYTVTVSNQNVHHYLLRKKDHR